MHNWQLSVPSKTFLLGEYLVLKGGPCLILATKKRFNLLVYPSETQQLDITGILPQSAAGKFAKHHEHFFRDYRLCFSDPYNQLGGFGASSAQFALLYALKSYVASKKIIDHYIISQYIHYAYNGIGMAPSGADIISQLHGGVCYFHKTEKKLQTFTWPFSNLNYCLIHTGYKISTHEHLQQIKNFDDTKMKNIVEKSYLSLQKQDSDLFVEAVLEYNHVLSLNKLVAGKTLELLKTLRENEKILAAKGCGALGADVILMLFEKSHQEDIIAWLKKKQFNVIIYGHDVEKGLEKKSD